MTSGIYQISFKDRAYYVGQSINCEQRWQQHTEKMQQGKASKLMQTAYDHAGMPEFRVIIKSHKDYLDILETYFINQQLEFGNCLNTAIPKVDRTINYEWLLSNPNLLLLPATSVLKTASDIAAELADLKLHFNEKYIEMKLKQAVDENANLIPVYHEQLHRAQLKIQDLKNRGWFQRLFNL